MGSKRTQPASANHSSGHACAWRAVTTKVSGSLPLGCPGRNPMATRAGMPSDRAMTVIAVAYCTQYPERRTRKSQTASSVSPGGIWVS